MFSKKFSTKIPEQQASVLSNLHQNNLQLAKDIQALERDIDLRRNTIALKRIEMKNNSLTINSTAYEAIIAAGYDETVEVDLDRNIFRRKAKQF